jgi:hypothetical protein
MIFCRIKANSFQMKKSLPSSLTAFASIKQVIEEKYGPGGTTPIDKVNILNWQRVLDH